MVRPIAKNFSRLSRRQISLAKMSAVRFEGESNVHAIVDYQPDSVSAGEFECHFGLSIEFARTQIFLAQLNESRAAFNQLPDLLNMGKAG